MNRWIRLSSSFVVSVVAAATFGATGCAENKETCAIIGVISPPARQDVNTACTYSAKDATSFSASGAVDLAITGIDYAAPLAVTNFLPPRKDVATNRTESNDIYLDRAEVTVFRDNAVVVQTITTPFSSTYVPAGETAVAYATLLTTDSINVIKANVGAATAADFRVVVKAYGTSSGNNPVETPEFQYVIRAGKGLLASGYNPATGACSSPAINSAKGCADTGSDAYKAATESLPCRLGNDQGFSCALLVTPCTP